MTGPARVVSLGDAALALEFEERIDVDVNQRAIAVAERLASQTIPGVRDIVPTFRSVAVHFDPLGTDVIVLQATLRELGAIARPVAPDVRVPIEVPVHYGGRHGPDLEAVARFASMSEGDVVSCHAGRTYRVFMLGFVPGFAYLGVVDPAIAIPRRTTPRVRVPAGSVAIAASQTGIYPVDTPGGWHVIGHTPLKPFDPARSEPFLLRPGDAVRFLPAGSS
jgi:KipI family sensor histidine kinase inhibitor